MNSPPLSTIAPLGSLSDHTRPPTRARASITSTWKPAEISRSAAARPANPAPTMHARIPRFLGGSFGLHPTDRKDRAGVPSRRARSQSAGRQFDDEGCVGGKAMVLPPRGGSGEGRETHERETDEPRVASLDTAMRTGPDYHRESLVIPDRQI